MLTSLRIQNFRSIRDASVKLGQGNLFIGPNNSGKSMFLKGIELVTDIVSEYPVNHEFEADEFESILRRSAVSKAVKSESVEFIAETSKSPYGPVSVKLGKNSLNDIITDIKVIAKTDSEEHNFKQESYESETFNFTADSAILSIQKEVNSSLRYDINPIYSKFNNDLVYQEYISPDGSNIIPFLFNLSQNYRGLFRRVETDLAVCVGNLTSLGTPLDPKEPGKLKLKFFDKNDIGYWAEEVSEGVLYFLALLCIVHQPDPPKLLLLEEPEKGIHPRRIREVMDFIFELARLRDIQIILTSHSPYVVDHFADIPECISVFDRENGETVIRNAADIMKETNEKLVAEGQEPIHYTDALGEYWVSGFLGGVPEMLDGGSRA